MALVFSFLKNVNIVMKVNFMRIISADTVSMSGKMNVSIMRVSGRMVATMDLACLSKMAVSVTRGTSLMVGLRVVGLENIPTETCTLENGKIMLAMVRE